MRHQVNGDYSGMGGGESRRRVVSEGGVAASWIMRRGDDAWRQQGWDEEL